MTAPDRDQVANARREIAAAHDAAAGLVSARTVALLTIALDLLDERLGQQHTDPRQLGGAIVDTVRELGGQGGLGTAVLDASRALILADVETVLVDDSGTSTPLLGLLLSGRVNGTDDDASVLTITDEDGHAALVTNLLHAAASAKGSTWRRHRKYAQRFDRAMAAHLADLPDPAAGGGA